VSAYKHHHHVAVVIFCFFLSYSEEKGKKINKRIGRFVWKRREEKRIINVEDFVHLRQDPAEMPGKKNAIRAVFTFDGEVLN